MADVIARFISHTQSKPEQAAYIFLDKSANEVQRYTYLELWKKATIFSQGLAKDKGSRILLDFNTDMDFAVALWGCLLSGCVLVPIASARSQADINRLQSIVDDISPALIIYSARRASFWQSNAITFCTENIVSFEDIMSAGADNVPALNINTNTSFDTSQIKAPTGISGNDLALVQYTSGTTGTPKGVCINHHNLFCNAQYLQEHFALKEGEILVSWLPHFHDMGLIGKFIQSIFIGGSLVFMEPLSFLARPINWFIAISRYKAVGTAAPNFAYDHCTDRILEDDLKELNLSCLRFASNGSEVVRQSTLDRFIQRFSSTGFNPAALTPTYGMAETTLYVRGKPLTERYDAVPPITTEHSESRYLIQHGRTSPVEVLIVNPDNLTVCPSCTVGEIWLRGENISTGYWRRPELNQRIFNAVTICGKGPYFRTGDLGLLDKNGVLFIAGRLKDLIIIRGKNFFPQDIETSAESIDEHLRSGYSAAFSVEINGREHAVLLHELIKQTHNGVDTAELTARIRMKISSELSLDLDTIAFVRQGSLPTTSSGKIQRGICRDKYLNGELTLLCY